MKTIKLLFVALLAVAMTACVEDKVYEGPNSIDAVTISPEAPTSFDDVVVTATVSGLLEVKEAVLKYRVNDGNEQTVAMAGNGKTFTATIPAQEDGAKVKYSVIITNEAGYTSTVEKDYTVGDKPSDYSKLKLNELYGAASADEGKYIELYNAGDDPIKLKDVVINKDEEWSWTGEEGEIIMGHSYFLIMGCKDKPGEGGSGPNPRAIHSGFSAKKSVLIELFDPNNNLIDRFQRGEKGDKWGDQSLPNNTQTWSRCPDGTGKFMIADGTIDVAHNTGAKNPATGEEDPAVVQ